VINKELDDAFNNILDCFTGADGGGAFMDLKLLIEDLERQAIEDNDAAAAEVIQSVFRFNSLINIAVAKATARRG
jgi:hypothetical protein